MVVLSMYSSQFSPRVIKNFLSNKVTLKVLGLFVGGFLYSIITLFFMRDDLLDKDVISATIGIIYAILAMIYFIIFIFNVSQSLQAANLINNLYKEAKNSIINIKEDNKDTYQIEKYKTSEYKYSFDINAKESGYIQNINYQEIVEKINIHSSLIVVNTTVGEFVVKNQKIATIYKNEPFDDKNTEQLVNLFIVTDSDRSSQFDYHFAIEKMVDISLRAISPGVNDPNTARYCINRIGMLIAKLADIEGNYAICKNQEKDKEIVYKVLILIILYTKHFNKLFIMEKQIYQFVFHF